jgi:hypothetical protein
MEERCLGLNMTYIKSVDIPFDYELLEDLDLIRNHENTSTLQYLKNEKSYRIFTDDPNEFLSNYNLYQEWRKL